MKNVIVITGAGGMGYACAKRIGAGHQLLLADYNATLLHDVAKDLSEKGYSVATQQLDVADKAAVNAFAHKAASIGDIKCIIHTAGLSPTMATPERIVEVDLIGTANMIDSFEQQPLDQTVGIFISSMSGYLARALTPEQQKEILALPTNELKNYILNLQLKDAGDAYSLCKKINQLQVAAAAAKWGQKGARIMSISPGIISTPMGQQEQASNPMMDYMLENTPVQRAGTPEDIAAVAEFIASPSAGFLTGSDILVDGGVISFLQHK
ncbi:MAG: short-chain dehydrogenase [Crocinitomicaceae bacterium]|nr:short-chain dehydrogenase [Crocinitomicaceae bacterium]|tara:strand:+ start:385 stop:1185 length:801 start_codon:yes stop_codon:yes gene_type:complete